MSGWEKNYSNDLTSEIGPSSKRRIKIDRRLKMKKLKLEERSVITPRMEWYFDEVPKQNTSKKPVKGRGQTERNELFPHMDWYFDEITKDGTVVCPVTGKKATVEVIRSATRDNTPFVDVAYCSIFGCAPTCKKECLRQINHMKHFNK
jgi:hypothetical protein